MFTEDDSILSSNKEVEDPRSEALYSILDTLEGFKDADGKLTLQIQYPRTSYWRSLTWSQTSNPVTEDTIEGFQLIAGDDEYD